jgi:hypothetical protein
MSVVVMQRSVRKEERTELLSELGLIEGRHLLWLNNTLLATAHN